LNNASDLCDEQVLFANFSIKEIPDATSITIKPSIPNDIKVFPNPVFSTLHIEGENYKSFDKLNVYNYWELE